MSIWCTQHQLDLVCCSLQISARIVHQTFLLQGVWEKDEMRKDDSFNTFREIFELALSHKVDMVLLGGDLFHACAGCQHPYRVLHE